MKRLFVVLGGLLVLPAFAEVSPFYYDDAAEYIDADYADDVLMVDEELSEQEVVASPKIVSTPKVTPRNSVSSRATSRASSNDSSANGRNSAGNTRAVASRTTSTRTATRGTTSRATASRSGAGNTSSGVATRRGTASNSGVTARSGTTTTSIIQTDTVNTPLYTGRVSLRSSAAESRVPTIRVASGTISTTSTTATSNVATVSSMDELAELTDYCKAQYVACMDNFCNVLDDNQGRCSCSKNLKNYEKTENALKAATEELQDVAQKIQYIGLTADEVKTLFAETEAESTMRGQTDNSQIKTNLDKIKNMIVDVKTNVSLGTDTSAMSFDLSNLLNFTISSTGFDLSSLFGDTTDTSSISNQRGETLYKTAASRCKTSVLNSCAAQGVDISVVANSYDLEIDKQCIVYERSLSDSNAEMTATVRNAKSILQKARLMVARNKNQYDLRECVSALDSCMQDDYVCGTDYEGCLDPTGKYIVNGAVVVGSLPGKPLNTAANTSNITKDSGVYATWVTGGNTYAWDTSNNDQNGNLAKYISDTMSSTTPVKSVSGNMSEFLQYKIGYNADGKNYGMCMSVLNKCQDYTYDKNGKYKPDNNVISEFLYRTLVQIKASQDSILAEYAENCISDVTACLSTNNYGTDDNKAYYAVNACKSLIATCMSVNGNMTIQPDPAAMRTWAASVYNTTTSSDDE